MVSHVTIGTSDPVRAAEFYDRVLETLEIPPLFRTDDVVAYGTLSGAKTFLVRPFNGQPPVPGNGGHIAFLAKTRAVVDAFYAMARSHGGVCEGEPGLRPHYHPNYYGAYVRDPEGNKLQAVCHSRDAS